MYRHNFKGQNNFANSNKKCNSHKKNKKGKQKKKPKKSRSGLIKSETQPHIPVPENNTLNGIRKSKKFSHQQGYNQRVDNSVINGNYGQAAVRISNRVSESSKSRPIKTQSCKDLKLEIDTGQKRKSQVHNKNIKKIKIIHHVQSESDSDAESYIDKFFDATEQTGSSSIDPVYIAQSSSEQSCIEGSDSESDDYNYIKNSNEENTMSFEELVDFYGNYKDQNNENKISNKNYKIQCTSAPPFDSKCSNNDFKKSNKKRESASSSWMEEDNDVDLTYEELDSDREASKMAVVSAAETIDCSDDEDYLPTYDNEDGVSVETSGEEELLDSEYTDSEITIDSDDEGEYDSSDISSDFDSEEDFSSEEYEDVDSYLGGSYDSEDDDDYIPSDDDDNLFISRGEAIIYDIDDNNVSFNSDIETAQIVEIPMHVNKVTKLDIESHHIEEDDCPELVPIYDKEGHLIDCADQLVSSHKKKTSKTSKKTKRDSDQQEIKPTSNSTTSISEDRGEQCSFTLKTAGNLDTMAQALAEVEEEVTMEDEVLNNYKFYTSIDMRMVLLVLKDTLYFTGYLTLQPLIGSLEVMGCHLKRGECRNVFAVKGFHSLNLTPWVDQTGYPKELMAGVLTRLEKHFQDIDLRDLEESFDPATSVLVLLQADCNNKRITVVNKYLSDFMLFPRPEYMRNGTFFTAEHLLNVEFYTEHIEKSTALYESNPDWEKIQMEKNSRVIVMGGKGSGKSTLCQYLINKNVNKFKAVVLIDLDIGQPIQHIPETISVTIVKKPFLGVATFDPVPPAKCLLFGSLDVVSSPVFYIQNVRQLIRYCQSNEETKNIPWIINTMGYITGFGEELMVAVVRIIEPTHVVQLEAVDKSYAIPNFKNILSSCFINQYNFNILRSEIQEFLLQKTKFTHFQFSVCYSRKGFTLNAPKRRSLMVLAHLARILDDSSTEWFSEVRPFCAPISKLQVLVTAGDRTPAEEELPQLLNATLVYLCRKEDECMYECLGIGIVRGVDKNNNVYLLQSLPNEELAKVTVLAVCSSSLPSTVFLQQSSKIHGNIPYVYNVDYTRIVTEV